MFQKNKKIVALVLILSLFGVFATPMFATQTPSNEEETQSSYTVQNEEESESESEANEPEDLANDIQPQTEDTQETNDFTGALISPLNEEVEDEPADESSVLMPAVSVSTWDELLDAIEQGENNIHLTKVISLSLGAGEEMTLNGNGAFILAVDGNRHFDIKGTTSTFVLENVTLDGGSELETPQNGGGIVTQGNVEMRQDSAIQNCSANVDGGGIFATGDVVLNGGRIENCHAFNRIGTGGGGIHAANVTMNDGAIIGCTTKESGGGVFASGTFIMEDGLISKCATIDASAFGGGVRAIKVVFNGGVVSECDAGTSSNGGGFYVYAEFEMNGGVIENCTNSRIGKGAAVYCYGVMTMTGGTIINCTSANNYGAVYVEHYWVNAQKEILERLSITGGEIINSPIIAENCHVSIENAKIEGSDEIDQYAIKVFGVYNEKIYQRVTLNIKDTTIANAMGGIHSPNVVMDNCILTDCVSREGGGIYAIKTVDIKNSEFTRCSTTHGNGGAIYTAALTMENSDFVDCAASYTGTKPKGYGGAVYVLDEATISNSVFKNCKSLGSGNGSDYYSGNAGAIYAYAATLNMSNCELDGCTSTGNAGAVNMTQGEIVDTTFKNCKANGAGGAISSSKELSLSGTSVFENCTANTGGAINAKELMTLSDDTKILNCTAYTGGALYLTNGTYNIEDNVLIQNCSANYNGGAICVTNISSFESSATIFNFASGATIDNCSSRYAGGIYIAYTGPTSNKEYYLTATLNGTIKDCVATSDGGGIWANAGNITFDGAQITRCMAGGDGGGIYVKKIGGNSLPAAAITITDTQFEHCNAGTDGGAVWTFGLNAVKTQDSSFLENTASKAYALLAKDQTLHSTQNTGFTTTSIQDVAYLYNNFDINYLSTEEILMHTVTFMVGEKVYAVRKVFDGEVVSAVDYSVSQRQKFLGWNLEENLYDFDLAVTGDITLVANIVNIYNVQFLVDGEEIALQQVLEGETAQAVKAEKKGFVFVQWVIQAQAEEQLRTASRFSFAGDKRADVQVKYDFASPVFSDIVLVAQFTEKQNSGGEGNDDNGDTNNSKDDEKPGEDAAAEEGGETDLENGEQEGENTDKTPQIPEQLPSPTQPGNTIVQDEDGQFIEIGMDGTPKGSWKYDEEQESWVFIPDGQMPKTGSTMIAAALGVATMLTAGGFALRKKEENV